MEPEKKTNWWGVAGIVGVLALGISAFGGSDTPTTQPANAITAPTVTETRSANNLVFPTPAPTVKTTNTIKVKPSTNSLSNDNYYTNVDGNKVHSPAKSLDNGIPAGASAKCRDGTYSFSQNRRGTCSHHGGVASWL